MANLQVVFGTSIVDADGDVKSLEIFAEVADTTTLATLQTWVTGTQDYIDLVTEGKILHTSVTVAFANSGTNKSDAVAGSDVEEGGLISFSLDGSKYRHSVFVPAVIEAAKSGNDINLAETNVANLITRLTATNNGVTPGNQYGNALDAAIKGAKTFRK